LFKIDATNPSDSAEVSFTCDDLELASRLCLDLYREGYAIRRIALPGGGVIRKDEIQGVIQAGLDHSQAALADLKRKPG
jgi:hypothetical protein